MKINHDRNGFEILDDYVYSYRLDAFRKIRSSRCSSYFIYRPSCKKCSSSYFMSKQSPTNFCSRSCAISREDHHNYGKKRPKEVGDNISKALEGRTLSKEHCVNISKTKRGKSHKGKGGVVKYNLALYDTHASKLWNEQTRRDPGNPDLLQVKCAYCNKWQTATRAQANARRMFIDGYTTVEHRFYCSENCKQVCPIYKQRKYPKDFKHVTSREVDPQLRQMVFGRDSWTCQICGKTVEEVELHCHHMDPATQNPMFQNDMDSCITLCSWCHNWIHSQYGCRYVDLRCKNKGGNVNENR